MLESAKHPGIEMIHSDVVTCLIPHQSYYFLTSIKNSFRNTSIPSQIEDGQKLITKLSPGKHHSACLLIGTVSIGVNGGPGHQVSRSLPTELRNLYNSGHIMVSGAVLLDERV